MEIENTTKAGGDAESKGVDDYTLGQKAGGGTSAADESGASVAQRAGGDAESKGVD